MTARLRLTASRLRLLASAEMCLLRATASRRLKNAKYSLLGCVHDARFWLMSALLNRFATREMRHAALLLGFDLALGYGEEGLLLGPLHEFSVGNELGISVRFGDSDEMRGAVQEFALERGLYQRARVRSGLDLANRRAS